MEKFPDILKNLDSLLWKPNKDEKKFVENLPDEFYVEVPYYSAKKMHWSGPACAQMLFEYNNKPVPSQEEIANEMGIDTWLYMNHETLEEDFLRFMTKRNFVPGIYFPALKLRPHFKNGKDMGDFMYRNAEKITEKDFTFFKSLLVKENGPVFMRIHFTTDDYNMPEEMAEHVDGDVGHAVLLVGYNSKGFIVNDPWNNKRWGGKKGGENTFITYEELRGPNIPVNSTYDFMATYYPLRAIFRIAHQVPFPKTEIDLSLQVDSPGLVGIQGDYYTLKNIKGILRLHSDFSTKEPISYSKAKDLAPGDKTILTWKIKTGSHIRSFPVSALVQATISLPYRAWERNNRNNEEVTINAEANIRISVKNPEWYQYYGKLS